MACTGAETDRQESTGHTSASTLAHRAYLQWQTNPTHYQMHRQGDAATFQDEITKLGTSHAWFGIVGMSRSFPLPSYVVRCEFSSKSELATLRRGQTVVVEGRLGPVENQDLYMSQCRLFP